MAKEHEIVNPDKQLTQYKRQLENFLNLGYKSYIKDGKELKARISIQEEFAIKNELALLGICITARTNTRKARQWKLETIS